MRPPLEIGRPTGTTVNNNYEYSNIIMFRKIRKYISFSQASLTGRAVTFIFYLSSFIFLATGCAEHRILITSEPAGAKVALDGQDKGITPLSVPFTFYGKREVIVEKDGYQTYKSIIPVSAPIFQVFPFDIMMLLVPYPFVDNHSFYFILEKQGKPDIKKSLERMERLKDHLEEKLKEDGTAKPR